MEENEKKDVQIKDEGLILINWEKGTVKDVYDLIMKNNCTITYSSSIASAQFIIAMENQLLDKVEVRDFIKAFTFAIKEFNEQVELMNKNKMEE